MVEEKACRWFKYGNTWGVCYYERCVVRGPTLALALKCGCHRGHDSACGRTGLACNKMRMRLVLRIWSPYWGNRNCQELLLTPRCRIAGKCKLSCSWYPRAGRHSQFQSTCGVRQLVWWCADKCVCADSTNALHVASAAAWSWQPEHSGFAGSNGLQAARASGRSTTASAASLIMCGDPRLTSSLKGRADSHQHYPPTQPPACSNADSQLSSVRNNTPRFSFM